MLYLVVIFAFNCLVMHVFTECIDDGCWKVVVKMVGCVYIIPLLPPTISAHQIQLIVWLGIGWLCCFPPCNLTETM